VEGAEAYPFSEAERAHLDRIRAQAMVGAPEQVRARLEALAEEMTNAVVVPTDMRQPDDIRRLVETAVDECGRVDVLVNNAGQGLHVPVEQIRLDDLIAITELNFYGTLLAMQAVIPLMRSAGGGCIINVSSGTTRFGVSVGAAGTPPPRRR
jgi:NADP-dependent 3-hydroxy acid dehydrogenase YdfG